jgi:hypothetical protein
MDKKTLYLQGYKILKRVTPLKKDCGSLCNKACCQGLDSQSGMYLYPGEAELQRLNASITIKPAVLSGHSGLLAVCNGECERLQRPLACRVFPLTAYYTAKDLLTIVMDPKARYICPLARNLTKPELNLDFVVKVRQVFRLLSADPGIKEFIIMQSRLLDEFSAIESRFK